MFVHYKNNNPEQLVALLQRCVTAGPLIVALLLLFWIGLMGSARANRRVLAVTVMLAIFPLAVLGLMHYVEENPYRVVSSSALVSARFTKQTDNQQIWIELCQRLTSSQLTDFQVEQALQNLASSLANQQRPRKKTLAKFMRDSHRPASAFLTEAHDRQKVSDEVLWQVLEAYHGRPRLAVMPLGFNGTSPQVIATWVGVLWDNTPELDSFEVKWSVKDIRKGGQPIRFELDGEDGSAEFRVRQADLEGEPLEVTVVAAPRVGGEQPGFTRAAPKLWDPKVPQKAYKLRLDNPDDVRPFAP